METTLQNLAGFEPSVTVQLILSGVALLVSVYALFLSRQSAFRLTDAQAETGTVTGLVVATILGALTGVLWATWNPVKIVPPFIHLRVFAFLIPVIGIWLGRGAGFVSGWVASMVWAVMAGAFVPLHTPIADGIFVGLTGWIPAHVLRGDRTNEQLLQEIQKDFWGWLIRCGLVCLFAGLFMSFFVAISLDLTTPLTFWISFWAIGVISDTGPMVLFTGIFVFLLLRATQRSWTWLPQF